MRVYRSYESSIVVYRCFDPPGIKGNKTEKGKKGRTNSGKGERDVSARTTLSFSPRGERAAAERERAGESGRGGEGERGRALPDDSLSADNLFLSLSLPPSPPSPPLTPPHPFFLPRDLAKYVLHRDAKERWRTCAMY